MNVVHRIGRYDLPVLSVVAVQRRTGLKAFFSSLWLTISMFIVSLTEGIDFEGWQSPGYDVLLNDGHKIHFIEEEKRQYDEIKDWHSVALNWYSACVGAGLRG